MGSHACQGLTGEGSISNLIHVIASRIQLLDAFGLRPSVPCGYWLKGILHSPLHVGKHLRRAKERNPARWKSVFYNPVTEVAPLHFCHILLAVSHQLQPTFKSMVSKGLGPLRAMSEAALHNGHLWEILFMLQVELPVLLIIPFLFEKIINLKTIIIQA